MSYGYAMQPIAIRAEASERVAFIRRTYAHLAGAILVFVGLECILLNLPVVQDAMFRMLGTGGYSWLIVLGLFMVVSWLANTWAHSETSVAIQYLGLGVYTVAEALIFLPLLYIANRYAPGSISTAAILTLAVFGGLTVSVFVTRKDFSFLGPILWMGSLLALGFIVVACLLPINLGMVFSFAMVALLSGYILYYTSAVLHHYRTDQHVAAALALFSSIATLFWYILRIVMEASRE
jgi:FtsH-binding integral membrane protein